jgi:membrane protease YdiL (CAAX protease family)
MIKIQRYIEKYTILTFYILTFLFSGLLLLFNLFVFRNAEQYGFTFPQLAPGIVAISMTYILKGKKETISLLRQLVRWKIKIQWYFLTLLISLILILSTFYAYMAITGFESNLIKPVDPIIYLSLVVGIVVGSVGEELGWRGMMLPLLQRKFNVFNSSIIVGFFWGIWHLQFSEGILGFILFTLTVVELSTLYTWLYNNSNGGLVIVVLFHSIYNLLYRFILLSEFGIRLLFIEIVVFGIIGIIIILGSKIFSRKNAVTFHL